MELSHMPASVERRKFHALNLRVILLMAEILHHLGCMKPYKQWEKLPTSTGDRQISAINSISTLNPNPDSFGTYRS